MYIAVSTNQATPELSQRLFGSTSTTISAAPKASTTNNTSVQEPLPLLEISDNRDSAPVHLPTILGLKIRAINPPNPPPPTPPTQTPPQTPSKSKSKTKQGGGSSGNTNSLLKQQLRGGAKDPEIPLTPRRITVAVSPNSTLSIEENATKELARASQEEVNACSGLQSLANAAEQQAAQVHHQLLLHMAVNNPMLKPTDYYQQQQHQQQQQQQASPSSAGQYMDDEMDFLMQDNQKDDEPDHDLLTLADENAGLPGYQDDRSKHDEDSPEPAPVPASRSGKKGAKRPIQRRRVRRKAQSTLDDQAEHLTEMSVRGLDLFRYASVVEGVYRCTECAKENMQKTFKNKYSFQRHAFLYHEGKHRKVFPCPVCSKEFSRPDKMKNHLKMTHENFTPPKDIGAFSPLKYLINAAAAGEMHTSIYQQQQQQEQEQAHYQRQLVEQEQQQQQHNASFDTQEDSSQLLLMPDVKLEDQDADDVELSDGGGYEASSNPAAAAAAMLSLQQDVIIKNEIQISPSPSPTPTAAPQPPSSCAVAEGKSLALATTAQTAT